MKILSIHCGHTSTVGLLEGDRVVAAISEERLLRLKNYSGFPFKALEWVQKNYLKESAPDMVVLPSNDPAFYFSRGKFDKNLIHSPIISGVSNTLAGGKETKEDIQKNSLAGFILRLFPTTKHIYRDAIYAYIRLNSKRYRTQIRKKVAKIAGVDLEKVIFEDHHTMHATSTLFNLDPGKPWLVFTCDGYGDGVCASVSKYENGELVRIATTPQRHSLGMLYAYTTEYLGMKKNQHEFKVMGLAPYAKEHAVEKALKNLEKMIWLDEDGLSFRSAKNLMSANRHLAPIFQGHRFDAIAGAMQKLTENLLNQWVKNAIQQTGIHDIAVSGGVFMNVKASMLINQMQEVNEMFVMPSAGDESLVFGGIFTGYRTLTNKQSFPQPINDLYLGNEYTDEEISQYIRENKLGESYDIEKMEAPHERIAQLLIDGKVVARMNGRMEWGARALGNRSILADPRRHDVVRIINELIKDRDFWMPFTPSMLDEDVKRYAKNPKNLRAPYMCIAFPSTKEAQEDLPAAMHPYDFTIRPQAVYQDWNPSYYALLAEFKKRTGVGAILNTSFNLHGEPNVCSIEDAIHTIKGSGLQYLAIGSYLIKKNAHANDHS